MMKVGELVEKLGKFQGHLDIVCYSPCGPFKITDVHMNTLGEVVLEGGGGACEHIFEGSCSRCSKLIAEIDRQLSEMDSVSGLKDSSCEKQNGEDLKNEPF